MAKVYILLFTFCSQWDLACEEQLHAIINKEAQKELRLLQTVFGLANSAANMPVSVRLQKNAPDSEAIQKKVDTLAGKWLLQTLNEFHSPILDRRFPDLAIAWDLVTTTKWQQKRISWMTFKNTFFGTEQNREEVQLEPIDSEVTAIRATLVRIMKRAGAIKGKNALEEGLHVTWQGVLAMRPTLEIALAKHDHAGNFPEYKIDTVKLFAPIFTKDFLTLLPEVKAFYKSQTKKILAIICQSQDI